MPDSKTLTALQDELKKRKNTHLSRDQLSYLLSGLLG